MKKKISVGSAVAIALIAAILTFQITYVAVSGTAADLFSKSGNDGKSFMNRVTSRLSEVDSRYRELYVGELNDDTLIDCVLKGYVAGTGDPYGAYYTADEYSSFLTDLSGESVGIGVNVIYNTEVPGIEIVNVMPNSPAEAGGIEVGDVIVYVGESREKVSDLGFDGAVSALRGDVGSDAVFSVLRDGEITDFTLKRAKVENVTVFPRVYGPDNTVGVIRITGFEMSTPDQFISAVTELLDDGCESLVFDLRYNPGGELNSIVKVLDYLLPEGPIIRVFDSNDTEVERFTSDASSLDCPMAVIVNSRTASAAELFTAALRDYDKAKIVGETTYGKGCMQSTNPLPDGGALHVTYRMFKPPFSESYHGVGIVPDVTVTPNEKLSTLSIYKVDDADDNQLTAAVETIDGSK